MSLLQRLAILGVVVGNGLIVLFIVCVVLVCGAVVVSRFDRSSPLIVQPDPSVDSPKEAIALADSLEAPTRIPEEFPYTFQEPIVLLEVPANIREIELSRRARRPSVYRRPAGMWSVLNYDQVLASRKNEDGTLNSPKPAEPLPPTSCRSVERAQNGYAVHDNTVWMFGNESGFGFYRMGYFKNGHGSYVASSAIDRVELVSLLTDDEPSVYVLDEMATPTLVRQAKRRTLDEFERLGLDAVRRGEHLVWTPEAPKRMFGAIRARSQCLECHPNAKRGDLLGAFTYYLDTPVNELAKP